MKKKSSMNLIKNYEIKKKEEDEYLKKRDLEQEMISKVIKSKLPKKKNTLLERQEKIIEMRRGRMKNYRDNKKFNLMKRQKRGKVNTFVTWSY